MNIIQSTKVSIDAVYDVKAIWLKDDVLNEKLPVLSAVDPSVEFFKETDA